MKIFFLLIIICCFTFIVRGQVHDDMPIPGNINISEPKPRMQGEGGMWVEPNIVDPIYPGGWNNFLKYIDSAIAYPKKALKNNIGGNVIVTFVVEKDGKLTDIKAFRSPSEELSNECIRILQGVVFKPGSQNGTLVRVQYSIPIFFDPNNPTQHKKPSVNLSH